VLNVRDCSYKWYLLRKIYMIKENCVVLTGAPGSGKSTILKILREKGYCCINEPVREVIAEQRAIRGSGVSDKNPALFVELMLSRAILRYHEIRRRADSLCGDSSRGSEVPQSSATHNWYTLPFRGWLYQSYGLCQR
jgi:ATPase subunit of ABC transporter with duplicated ATPase domains